MKNKYKVGPRKWRKWSTVAKITFIKTFEAMRDNQDLFLHPKDKVTTKAWWRTTAWNAAWIAADHVDEALEEIANGSA